MLSAVAGNDKDAPSHWLMNGGADSLLSWGIPPSVPPAEWAGRIPLQHLIFLRDLEISHRIGPYLFVHAGIRPGVPLDQQSRQDMMWIREPFLSSRVDHGVVVVHGHTGAVLGGALTCLVLEGDKLGFLQT